MNVYQPRAQPHRPLAEIESEVAEVLAWFQQVMPQNVGELRVDRDRWSDTCGKCGATGPRVRYGGSMFLSGRGKWSPWMCAKCASSYQDK